MLTTAIVVAFVVLAVVGPVYSPIAYRRVASRVPGGRALAVPIAAAMWVPFLLSAALFLARCANPETVPPGP